MGIPTIRREKIQYLADTVKSLIEGMTEEEKNICLIIVFVAEVSETIVGPRRKKTCLWGFANNTCPV